MSPVLSTLVVFTLVTLALSYATELALLRLKQPDSLKLRGRGQNKIVVTQREKILCKASSVSTDLHSYSLQTKF